jgi:hypothetical protein
LAQAFVLGHGREYSELARRQVGATDLGFEQNLAQLLRPVQQMEWRSAEVALHLRGHWSPAFRLMA